MDYKNIDLKWQNMLAGIKAQPDFIKNSPRTIYDEIKREIKLDSVPEKLYLVGCGDSWYCGMATRFAFEEWAGIPTEAVQSLEFSRYLVKYAPKNSMALMVSNSGKVSRTIESAIKAKAHGLLTVGATSNFESGLSKEVDYVIDLAYSERRFAPGTSSYMASMIVQYCMAIFLAEAAGKLNNTEVDKKLDEIASLAEPMEKTIEVNLPIMEELVKKLNLSNQAIFIGGGPNYGTAFFSMAKVIESTRTKAVGQELEEWAHEQFFFTNNNTITFVITPPGASVDRAREQIYAINQMGSTSVAICDPDDKETTDIVDVVSPVYGKADELLTPILYCVPAEIFAFHYAVHNNLSMLGFDNKKIKDVNWQQIFESEITR
ncbi:MAG: SIS domain-containing protein [Chloroflexi bacterium]|jgi:glutamine---fructose-6-phosphate transaminase (isomerizing)|nr:SIS domain-containing protein [Chloroflexota bacterium]MBT3669029.1 SIS domain-containing protein [Chloroflexota bacterium]MBT4003630.1 SIS domain-containing protein [Chloroflexota bacterium]MBT4305000.1 SIS domain-containing protein [Chloroflexota bacterium]MBT4533237.1 SIS domain-containing protein [Chloroflexota bacterium]